MHVGVLRTQSCTGSRKNGSGPAGHESFRGSLSSRSTAGDLQSHVDVQAVVQVEVEGALAESRCDPSLISIAYMAG